MPDTPRVMIARIDGLLALKEYQWAKDTLEGIRANIEYNDRVTLRQQEAVEHIIIGRLRHDCR